MHTVSGSWRFRSGKDEQPNITGEEPFAFQTSKEEDADAKFHFELVLDLKVWGNSFPWKGFTTISISHRALTIIDKMNLRIARPLSRMMLLRCVSQPTGGGSLRARAR
jgi:hypothetical protein